MKLTLVPETRSPRSTISRLFVNGVFECFVLEPANPIPAGAYEIKLQPSLKFHRLMPFLQNVPGHEGIEIHWGNTPAETRDCLIVGRTTSPDFVGESVAAFNALFTKLEETNPITIEITRQAILPAAPPVEELKGALPMADPAPATPKLQLTNHAPVTATLLASAVTSVMLTLMKAKYGLDLNGQEANITIIIGAIIGYLTKGQPQ